MSKKFKKYKNNINIYSHSTLSFKLKKSLKKRYYGNEGLDLAWDFKSHFLGKPNLRFGGLNLKKNRENFKHKGIIEKCVSFFFLYSFYECLFFLKKRKKGITG